MEMFELRLEGKYQKFWRSKLVVPGSVALVLFLSHIYEESIKMLFSTSVS